MFEPDESGLELDATPAEPTLSTDGSVDVTVSLTNKSNETSSSSSTELTALLDNLAVTAVETEGDVLDSDGIFDVGDVVGFVVSANPPGPGESISATFTLETGAEQEGPVGDIGFEGDLNTDDPSGPVSVIIPVSVVKGLEGEFDDGNGTIESWEVLSVIDSHNDGDDGRVTNPRTVLAVIAEYNRDGQWGNVDT